jgi:hypothetical protein
MHVKNTPADSSNLQGCQTWGRFWPFEVGYSVANPKWEAHSLSSVVLPKPAGAETSVSLRVTPSFLDCLLAHRPVNLRTSAEPLTPLRPLRPLRPFSVISALSVSVIPHPVHPRKAVDLPERIPPQRIGHLGELQ